MARTLKLTIAYDGTAFAGWQRQAAARTVQADIEDALLPIEGGRAVVVGAGRTDAGVHAAAQVASVSLGAAIPCDDLMRALNATLARDVRILSVEEQAPGFNAQFAAKTKTYRYWIGSNVVLPPQMRHSVWHVPQPLDVGAMHAAAQVVIGSHDFAAFQAAGSDVITTVREVMVSRVSTVTCDPVHPMASGHGSTSLVLYEIEGAGFLRHMVRNIVGTLIDVGHLRRGVDDVRAILASRDRARASATAPPHGLVLWSVTY